MIVLDGDGGWKGIGGKGGNWNWIYTYNILVLLGIVSCFGDLDRTRDFFAIFGCAYNTSQSKKKKKKKEERKGTTFSKKVVELKNQDKEMIKQLKRLKKERKNLARDTHLDTPDSAGRQIV